jgi:hypothetical protein
MAGQRAGKLPAVQVSAATIANEDSFLTLRTEDTPVSNAFASALAALNASGCLAPRILFKVVIEKRQGVPLLLLLFALRKVDGENRSGDNEQK